MTPLLAAAVRQIAAGGVSDLAGAMVREVLGSVSRDVQLSVSVQLDIERLLKLRKGARGAVNRAANKAAKPVRLAVIANAMRIARYGFLGKSIGTKTKLYPNGRVLSVVGPKMSYSRMKGKFQKGPRKGQSRRHVPYLYSWLLERGTKRARPRPFLKPAWDSDGGERYLRRLAEGIQAELAKLTS